MAWQSDLIKYGLVVGAVGVGGYFLVTRIRSALGAPVDAVSAAAEQAGEALGGAGEALGAAAEATGEAIGGVPEAVGSWAGNLAACPFCNGLPNLLGTSCEKCSEAHQQNLPSDSGQEIPQQQTPESASGTQNYIVEWPSGQIADVGLTSEAAQYYRDTPGVKVTKSDILGDIGAWFRSDPLGLQTAGDNIQTWALGGASTFTDWVFPSSAPEQKVAEGQAFSLNTGYEVAETGVNSTNAQGTLNVGNKALDTSAAPVNQVQEKVNTVSGDGYSRVHIIHNTSNDNFGSSTVPNTTNPSVTETNTANTQFMSSSTGDIVAPNITISQGRTNPRGTPSSGTGGSSSSGSGSSGSASSGNSSSSGSSTSGGSTTSSKSKSGGSGSTSGGTSSSSSSGTASSGNTSSSSKGGFGSKTGRRSG
jgi:hypothetical protein